MTKTSLNWVDMPKITLPSEPFTMKGNILLRNSVHLPSLFDYKIPKSKWTLGLERNRQKKTVSPKKPLNEHCTNPWKWILQNRTVGPNLHSPTVRVFLKTATTPGSFFPAVLSIKSKIDMGQLLGSSIWAIEKQHFLSRLSSHSRHSYALTFPKWRQLR